MELIPIELRKTTQRCKDGNLKACDVLRVWTKQFPKDELVKGGYGDGYPDENFSVEQLNKGIKVELEHTNDPWIAKEITKDHLVEESRVKDITPIDSVYYDDLEQMEDAWKKTKRTRKRFLKK